MQLGEQVGVLSGQAGHRPLDLVEVAQVGGSGVELPGDGAQALDRAKQQKAQPQRRADGQQHARAQDHQHPEQAVLHGLADHVLRKGDGESVALAARPLKKEAGRIPQQDGFLPAHLFDQGLPARLLAVAAVEHAAVRVLDQQRRAAGQTHAGHHLAEALIGGQKHHHAAPAHASRAHRRQVGQVPAALNALDGQPLRPAQPGLGQGAHVRVDVGAVPLLVAVKAGEKGRRLDVAHRAVDDRLARKVLPAVHQCDGVAQVAVNDRSVELVERLERGVPVRGQPVGAHIRFLLQLPGVLVHAPAPAVEPLAHRLERAIRAVEDLRPDQRADILDHGQADAGDQYACQQQIAEEDFQKPSDFVAGHGSLLMRGKARMGACVHPCAIMSVRSVSYRAL